MKIFWIGPWSADALSAQVRGSMAQALHDVGNEVGAVVIGDHGSWRNGGYDWVIYCPSPQSWAGKGVNQARISRAMAAFRGDVIVLGEKAAHLAPVAAAVRRSLRRKWKIVVDVRTVPIPRGETGGLERRAGRFWRQLKIGLCFADAWMAITTRLKRVVDRRVDTSHLPCLIWESAADRVFLDDTGVSPAKDILACGHELNLLYLGSLSKGRRLDLAVRAMAELDNPGNRVGLHVFGKGDHRSELMQLCRACKLTDVVHLWDVVPYAQVLTTIHTCDLGILPLPDCQAWNTSSALKLYEYMGAGRPVLVSDIPAHRDMVGGRPFAFFMREYSPKGFIQALECFLDLPAQERRALGRQAREFVRSGHTWHHRATAIHRFLSGLIGGESMPADERDAAKQAALVS